MQPLEVVCSVQRINGYDTQRLLAAATDRARASSVEFVHLAGYQDRHG